VLQGNSRPSNLAGVGALDVPYKKTRCGRRASMPSCPHSTHANVISTSPLQVTLQRLLQPEEPSPRHAHAHAYAAFRVTGSNILFSVLPSCPSPAQGKV